MSTPIPVMHDYRHNQNETVLTDLRGRRPVRRNGRIALYCKRAYALRTGNRTRDEAKGLRISVQVRFTYTTGARAPYPQPALVYAFIARSSTKAQVAAALDALVDMVYVTWPNEQFIVVEKYPLQVAV